MEKAIPLRLRPCIGEGQANTGIEPQKSSDVKIGGIYEATARNVYSEFRISASIVSWLLPVNSLFYVFIAAGVVFRMAHIFYCSR